MLVSFIRITRFLAMLGLVTPVVQVLTCGPVRAESISDEPPIPSPHPLPVGEGILVLTAEIGGKEPVQLIPYQLVTSLLIET